jgi:two-component system response regulator
VQAPLPAGPDAFNDRAIFAVDDDPDDRLQLGRLLQQSGLKVPFRIFGKGEELVDALLRVLKGDRPPLACFVDIKMAGLSGFDVLRWIRCQGALDGIPVIMLSSSDDPQKLTEAHLVGAQCYVRKFPPASEFAVILCEALRYSSDHSTQSAFRLPCNLLLNATASTHPRGTAVA